MDVLTVDQVTTAIKDKKLIDNISFSLQQGSIMALVGHNGAGKSTLMKTILSIMDKTTGKIIIQEKYDQDEDFLTFKQKISYLPEEPLLMTELTVMQHFQLYGISYGLSEDTLLERTNRYTEGFELTDKLDEYPESLSKGMRQKVQTICAFLPDTPILLIDEPFMGLDVYAIDYLKKLIIEKALAGTSILLTTHQLDVVKDLAEHFMMLQHGKILNMGPIHEFDTIKRGSDQ